MYSRDVFTLSLGAPEVGGAEVAGVYNQLELTLPPPLHSEEQKEKDPWTCFSKSEVKSVHSIERSLLGQFYFTKRHTYSNEMVV